jgi:hypothetical protein
MGVARGGTATDAGLKSDTRCSYDMDAVPTADDRGNPCIFFIPPPPNDGTIWGHYYCSGII